MKTELAELVDSLEALSANINSTIGHENTAAESHGSNYPPVNRQDFALLIRQLLEEISAGIGISDSAESRELVRGLTKRVRQSVSTLVPNLFNGNGHVSIPGMFSTLDLIRRTLQLEQRWLPPDADSLPPEIKRRLRAVTLRVDRLTSEAGDLEIMFKAIRNAHEVSENLEIDMQDLATAKEQVGRASADSARFAAKAEESASGAHSFLEKMEASSQRAEALISKCEQAYQITTTVGLAASFDERAKNLAKSMNLWVWLLAGSLLVGGVIGFLRISKLTESINAESPNWGVIWMNVCMSIVSIGAPLWFSWLATKQISQRFRLSEDYAYKASVSKAYEGYRREASTLDPAFQSRLFDSALSRLDEAPLRFMKSAEHESPWQELLASDQLKKAMEQVPELRDKVIELVKGVMRRDQPPSSG